jgi:hypothetical protein
VAVRVGIAAGEHVTCSYRRDSSPPHHSGHVVVVDHSTQLTGEVLGLGFVRCIDTNCARGKGLTALDIDTGCTPIVQTEQKVGSLPTVLSVTS